jgi:predicted phosphodiesterase
MLTDTWLILSDVHANHPALESVLGFDASRLAKTKISLGDSVGYGDWPVETWDRLRSFDVQLMGNHESMILREEERSRASRDASASAALHAEALGHRVAAFEHLPRCKKVGRVLLYHGAPDSWETYIWNEEDIEGVFEENGDCDLLIGGHLHVPRFAKQDRGAKNIEFEDISFPVSRHLLDLKKCRYQIVCPSLWRNRLGPTEPGYILLHHIDESTIELRVLFLE